MTKSTAIMSNNINTPPLPTIISPSPNRGTMATVIQAISELKTPVGPDHVVTFKVPIASHELHYHVGQTVRLINIALQTLARSFLVPDKTEVLEVVRPVRQDNPDDAKIRERQESQWSVTKKNNEISRTMLHYPLTPVFNSVELTAPFERFMRDSGLHDEGMEVNRQKAGDANDREGVY